MQVQLPVSPSGFPTFQQLHSAVLLHLINVLILDPIAFRLKSIDYVSAKVTRGIGELKHMEDQYYKQCGKIDIKFREFQEKSASFSLSATSASSSNAKSNGETSVLVKDAVTYLRNESKHFRDHSSVVFSQHTKTTKLLWGLCEEFVVLQDCLKRLAFYLDSFQRATDEVIQVEQAEELLAFYTVVEERTERHSFIMQKANEDLVLIYENLSTQLSKVLGRLNALSDTLESTSGAL